LFLADPATRMSSLRRASTACADALRDRTQLAPADRDDGDAIKSDDLTIKISQLRKLVSALHAGSGEPLRLADACALVGFPSAATSAPGVRLPEVLVEARDLGTIIDAGTDGGRQT
jgi:hypothetical protein